MSRLKSAGQHLPLLAVMGAVEEFGRALLKPLGAPGGVIEAFIEVPFRVNDVSLRPDGIIAVTRAGKTWSALVEVKTGSTSLDTSQIDAYIDLARQLEFDALITISNQFGGSSSEFPVAVDRRKLQKLNLHHWSWIALLTEAVVQKEHRGVADPDQAYILGELIRYLSDPRSGVVAFSSMGEGWTAVRDGARNRTLRHGDPSVIAVAARWDELIRYAGLDLTKDLGAEVSQVLSAKERSPEQRQRAVQESLADEGMLMATLSIPRAAGNLDLVADLRAREISASTRVDAPQEGRSKGRVSWLLRQLTGAPAELKVESRAAYATSTQALSLADAQLKPEGLYPEGGREIKEFVLTLSRVPGLNRDSGRGSFSDSVVTLAHDFYGTVLQPLRAWKEAPPRLVSRESVAEKVEERVVEILPTIADEVRAAQKESGTGDPD